MSSLVQQLNTGKKKRNFVQSFIWHLEETDSILTIIKPSNKFDYYPYDSGNRTDEESFLTSDDDDDELLRTIDDNDNRVLNLSSIK